MIFKLNTKGSNWANWVKIGHNWTPMSQIGSGWVRLGQVGSKLGIIVHQWVLLGQIGSYWVWVKIRQKWTHSWAKVSKMIAPIVHWLLAAFGNESGDGVVQIHLRRFECTCTEKVQQSEEKQALNNKGKRTNSYKLPTQIEHIHHQHAVFFIISNQELRLEFRKIL